VRGGARKGAGRKPVKIDLMELEKLCALHATDKDLSDLLGVSVRTIENRRKQPKFAAAMARGKARGRISVRRAQMKLLEAGNAAIAIWLGKILLGQREVRPIELSGPNGQPAKISLEVIDDILRQISESTSGSESD
jgi:hypothetical protein